MANTLSDKIADILNTAPISYDPEDDIHEETTARVVSNDLGDESDEEIIGKFRKQNVELLEDVDNRYKGKRATRRTLGGDEWGSDDSNLSKSDDDSGDSNMENEAVPDDSSSVQEDSDGDESVEESINSDIDDNEESFTHIEEPDISLQVQKGLCIRQQLNMWENLLEMRIQLQKCVIAGNKLPQTSSALKKNNNSVNLSETKKVLTNLLDKFLYLQLLLVRKYPETKSLFSDSNQVNNKADDDEEIPSDTEDEQQSDVDVEMPRKKQKIDYVKVLGTRHDKYKSYRDSVIQKWNDKTRIAGNKSGNALHSVLKQIDHILSDKEKLIKRTQLSRIDYGLNNDQDKADEIHNPEIFDDTDFYHQLLRELIEHKSADLTDPVQLGRQWIQLQSLRSKMKRKIDTRATKGRKIRYAVHSKLVNFMAPVEDITWQNDAKAELYNSLFGKGQALNKS